VQADYEENPFSRRAAEFVPSPAHNNARWNALGSPSIEANYLTEAVVGSLPKAMTPSERTRMTSRLGASPSLKTMKDIPEVSGWLVGLDDARNIVQGL
jgi:hypothetical protein